MHGKEVFLNATTRQVVGVLVLAEVLEARHAHVVLEALGDVGPHVADGGVHGVIARSGVDAPPREFHVHHPLGELNATAGVMAEVAHEVLLRLTRVVLVVAGVQNQDVTLLHLHLRGDHLRGDDAPVLDVVRDVDDDALVDELGERERGHVGASVGGVNRAVEVSAGVQRGLDALGHDAVGLESLRVVDLAARVPHPAGCVHSPVVRQVNDLHCGSSFRHRMIRSDDTSSITVPAPVRSASMRRW
ncbi:unannotated protein [freshwater metagenome]|uniref:Unannotated protein n=1 Tax=freshwater metagenome TaxID=449393 RepID=A0A6J7R5U9_9ZZZZ